MFEQSLGKINRFAIVIERQIFIIAGCNGAGKTTFLRMVNQIFEADQGELLFDGETMTAAHARSIGYLPEERGLYKKMKVECISTTLNLHTIS